MYMSNVPSVSDYLSSYAQRERLSAYQLESINAAGSSESTRRAEVSTVRVDAYRSTYYAPTATASLASSVLTGAYDSAGMRQSGQTRSGGYFTAVIT
jgi:hypothetical protein